MKLLKNVFAQLHELTRNTFVQILYVLPNKVSTMLASSNLGCNAEKSSGNHEKSLVM